jgi:hypothetical protein
VRRASIECSSVFLSGCSQADLAYTSRSYAHSIPNGIGAMPSVSSAAAMSAAAACSYRVSARQQKSSARKKAGEGEDGRTGKNVNLLGAIHGGAGLGQAGGKCSSTAVTDTWKQALLGVIVR